MEGDDPSCPTVPRVGEVQRTSAPAVLCFRNSTHVGHLVCGYRLCRGRSACELGARLGSYNFSSSVEFPGFGGIWSPNFLWCWCCFCCQNQAVDTVYFHPTAQGEVGTLLLGPLTRGAGQSLLSKFQQLLPARTPVDSDHHIAQSGLGGELFVSAWKGGGRFHSFPNKRLVILPLGLEIQLKSCGFQVP